MTCKVELGAPSLTGKGANGLVTEAFAKAKYPMKVVVSNHMPRPAVLPEVAGLVLGHCACKDGFKKTVEIESFDQLQRLASSVEQIAELNGYKKAVTIEEVTAAPAAPAKGKAGADVK